MAKFSDAFLQGLRGGGRRGSPTDPMLQRADQYGSSNPLAKSIGGMFGMQMDTGQELTQAANKQITAPVGSVDAITEMYMNRAKYAESPAELESALKGAAEMKLLQEKQGQQKMLADVAAQKETDRVTKLNKEEKAQSAFNKYVSTKHPELKSLADANVLTPTTLDNLLKDSYGTDDSSFAVIGGYIDPKTQQRYSVTSIRNKKDGNVSLSYVPLGGDPAATPTVGVQLVPYGGAYGQTGEERGDQAVSTAKAIEFGKTIVQAPTALAGAREASQKATTMLELLTKIETGGWLPETEQAVNNFFGTTGINEATFEAEGQKQMLIMLSTMIKGNPTPREMDEVMKAIAGVGKTKGLNKALLNDIIQVSDRIAERSIWLTRPDADLTGYSDFIESQYKTERRSRKWGE